MAIVNPSPQRHPFIVHSRGQRLSNLLFSSIPIQSISKKLERGIPKSQPLRYIVLSAMAGVAKWLRQRLVVPPFGGSSPLIRPHQIGSILEKESGLGLILFCFKIYLLHALNGWILENHVYLKLFHFDWERSIEARVSFLHNLKLLVTTCNV